MKNYLLLTLLILTFSLSLSAQITTSTITGVVSDDAGETLPGAVVVAVHTPTGTEYGVSSLDEGRFYLPNMKIGGPYKVTSSYVGFSSSYE